MNDFVILTDSSCDLPSDIADSLGLVVAPLTFEMEGGSYTNYLDWREIGAHAFYDKLRGTALAPTSAVNVGAFTEFMEPVLAAGKDILYLGFSSGLSATWQNGEIAAADLREKYPERAIYTVDTLCASLGQGFWYGLPPTRSWKAPLLRNAGILPRKQSSILSTGLPWRISNFSGEAAEFQKLPPQWAPFWILSL